MKKNHQSIKCNVDTCKHNDCKSKMCQLDVIKIGSCNGCTNCKDDTICDSFEDNKKQGITLKMQIVSTP